ncbi:MAG: hypothetical protein AAB420_02875 [Patescibacteria group bacterium]
MKRVAIVIFSVISVVGILRLANAGSLTPSSSPAGTMYTQGNIFNPLASTSYDSSAIASSSTGSVIQISKCIVEKLHGGTC